MTNQPLFVPVGFDHLTGEIECLVASAAGLADDCNKAGRDQVNELTRQFAALVEEAKASPEVAEVSDVPSFVYYATMAKLGHGVGLNDDKERWGPRAIDYARTGTLSTGIAALAAWIESNLSTTPSAYTLTVCATVAAITKASARQGETARDFSILATRSEICDWVSWIDGGRKSTKAQDKRNLQEYSPLDFTRLLDELGARHEGGVWRVELDTNNLLLANRFRLPRLADRREVIGASLRLSVVKVVCPNDGDVTSEGRLTSNEIEAGRDSNYVPA